MSTLANDHIANEITEALNIFTAEGFAESVGFDAGPAGIWAEEYDTRGNVATRYKITFTIEEEESN